MLRYSVKVVFQMPVQQSTTAWSGTREVGQRGH